MSKIFKGIAKAVKNIVKGVKKVFKKIVKSKLFKVVLIAVAIYFGGAALGLWGGGGAAAGAGAGAVVTPVVTTAPATVAATTGTATTGAGLATASEVSGVLTAATPTATVAGAGTSAGLATAGEVATALTAAPAAAAPSFLTTIGSGVKAAGAFVQANPLVTAMGMQGLSSALAPDEMELLEAREDSRKREFEAVLASRRENLTGFSTLPLLHQTRDTVTSLRDRRRGSP